MNYYSKFLVLLLLSGLATGATANMIRNADWTAPQYSNNEPADWSVVSGRYNLPDEARPAVMQFDGTVIQRNLPLRKRRSYELSLEVRANAPATFKAAIEWVEKDHGITGFYPLPVTVSKEWQKVSWKFEYAPQQFVDQMPHLGLYSPDGKPVEVRNLNLSEEGVDITRPVTRTIANAAPGTPDASRDLTEEEANFFPLFPWNLLPSPFLHTANPNLYRDMADCGLTLASFVGPDQLDQVGEAGLKAFVFDGSLLRNWKSFDAAAAREAARNVIQKVAGHPAVYGYYLCDEPSAGCFNGLRQMVEIMHEEAPGKELYINLLPNYAAAETQLEAPDYPAYLDRYITEVKPNHFGYDFYGLVGDAGTPLRAGYWENLRDARAASLKYDIPFWVVTLTSAHFEYRIPSQADLNFEVFSSLAYGARGIGYFIYLNTYIGNYREAPINQFGDKTPTYDKLRYTNKLVQTIAPILNRVRSDEVYHLPADEPGTSEPSEHSLIAAIDSDGKFLVGDFTQRYTGERYVMIVNRDLLRSHHLGSIRWRKPLARLDMVVPYRKNELTWFGGENLWLAPGQGVMLKVEESN